MSKSWSKEDRIHFEKSEVMTQLEKNVVDNYKKLEEMQKKIAAAAPTAEEIKALTSATKDYNTAVKETKRLESSPADDAEGNSEDEAVDSEEECAEDGLVQKEAVLEDLKKMIKVALDRGEYDLVYKIERTIDSIEEREVSCE